MKQLLILLAFNLFLINLQAQQNGTKDLSLIDCYKWSDHTTFKIGSQPKIKGYGPMSDSLSNVMNGITFYHINEAYYPIQSWADYYYYWFTQKFPALFHCPAEYEYYYFAEDDYGMANYIFGKKFLYDYYPSNIIVRFDDRPSEANKSKCSSKTTKFNKDQFYKDVKCYEQKIKKNPKYTSKLYKRNKNFNGRLKTISTKKHKNIITRPSNSLNKPDVSREYNKSNKKTRNKNNNIK